MSATDPLLQQYTAKVKAETSALANLLKGFTALEKNADQKLK